MSGNPSTSSGGGGSGSDGATCDLRFETVVASPRADQVAGLGVGEVLIVALQENPPAVTVLTGSGALVGGITQRAAQLRACMQQGFTYAAEVLSINGGAVTVHIHLTAE